MGHYVVRWHATRVLCVRILLCFQSHRQIGHSLNIIYIRHNLLGKLYQSCGLISVNGLSAIPRKTQVLCDGWIVSAASALGMPIINCRWLQWKRWPQHKIASVSLFAPTNKCAKFDWFKNRLWILYVSFCVYGNFNNHSIDICLQVMWL